MRLRRFTQEVSTIVSFLLKLVNCYFRWGESGKMLIGKKGCKTTTLELYNTDTEMKKKKVLIILNYSFTFTVTKMRADK